MLSSDLFDRQRVVSRGRGISKMEFLIVGRVMRAGFATGRRLVTGVFAFAFAAVAELVVLLKECHSMDLSLG